MKQLTEAERAYRRGALQAVQYLLQDLQENDDVPMKIIYNASEWENQLVTGRDSLDVDYLGKYLDTIRSKVKINQNRARG